MSFGNWPSFSIQKTVFHSIFFTRVFDEWIVKVGNPKTLVGSPLSKKNVKKPKCVYIKRICDARIYKFFKNLVKCSVLRWCLFVENILKKRYISFHFPGGRQVSRLSYLSLRKGYPCIYSLCRKILQNTRYTFIYIHNILY